jgi:methylmalonyl-CoA mutase C-terminal domain/subunit
MLMRTIFLDSCGRGFPSRIKRGNTQRLLSQLVGKALKEEVAITAQRKIRVLIAKPGLDGHDRGAKVLAAAFRDAGMEVIYLGLRQTPEMITEAALQEDADVIALSILSGAHMTIFPRVLELMKQKGLNKVLLTGGGIIPPEDVEELHRIGVGRLFGPGTPVSEPIQYIQSWVSENPGV